MQNLSLGEEGAHKIREERRGARGAKKKLGCPPQRVLSPGKRGSPPPPEQKDFKKTPVVPKKRPPPQKVWGEKKAPPKKKNPPKGLKGKNRNTRGKKVWCKKKGPKLPGPVKNTPLKKGG